MNENNFDNFSDAELRQEMRKYGLPAVPVTETTRKLLIKRLKNHVMNEASLSRSSKRRTIQSHIPATPSRRTHISPTNTHDNIQQRRTLGTLSCEIDADVSSSRNIDRNLYLSNEGVSHINKEYDHCAYTRLGERNNSSPRSSKHAGDYPTKSSPKIYLPPPILAKDVQYASSTQMDIDRTKLHNGREYPGVVSRLLKLRDITMRGNLSTAPPPTKKNSLYLTDSDSDSVAPSTHFDLRRRPIRSYPSLLWRRLDIKGRFKQAAVPYLLINCLGLFFLVLAVLYMTKPPDMPSTMLEKSTQFTLCDDVTGMATLARPSINCIDNDLIGASLALNKELIQLLQINTEMHFCKDNSISPEVSGTEFIKHLYKKRTTDAAKLLRSFHAAMYLIERNPQWKILIINKSDNQQLHDIYKQDVRFVLHKPYLPLKCNLFNKLQRFFIIIGSVFLLAVLVGLVLLAVRFFRQRSIIRVKTIENFCKEIRKELMQRSLQKNDPNSGEIVINHLRDKVIPLNKRKSLLWAWNEALDKLESGDSRIQFGSIIQNGEEFRTMKWLDNALPVSTQSSPFPYQEKLDDKPQKKHWQSPAFDNVNKILDPPTNCLKIRHMFDSAEANHPDLKQSIIESILEKVGSQCRIYDVQLDRQNCCVYIRCASERDAGTIHNEINGWWFDNRLVSIKFLRLQRFLMRYPNSTNSTPLTITN